MIKFLIIDHGPKAVKVLLAAGAIILIWLILIKVGKALLEF